MPPIETIIGAAILAFGVVSGFHALMNKRDPRSTLGWMTLCVLVPVIGMLLYWILGVNRIKTKAKRWQQRGRFSPSRDARDFGEVAAELSHTHPAHAEAMAALERIARRVTGRPLLRGNCVEPLFNGEQAYPAMIEAISNAETSVRLCTYLFETDEIGRKFVDALGASAARGVDVRVLVDAIGERYSSRPRASKMLRHREGVKVERFLPLTLSLRGLRVNLRNHRKLLIVDSELAFTGGMNIGRRHMVTASGGDQPTRDVQFRVTGPVVHAIEDSFFEDWYFASGDEPERDKTVSASETAGDAMCRVISDGPNEDFEVLTWILVGAMGVAKRRIRIMTPYFIPSRELLSALTAATLRGVEVDIVLPSNNNLPFVAWACQAMLDEVIHYGTRVYYQPPPFDHTKLLIVDDLYVLLGSANLDPRSLRLNFEFNLEVYDLALARQMTEHFEQVLAGSRQVTHEELAGRSAPIKIRDALAKLASPYL